MSDFNEFRKLKKLPDNVLAEVVREGEDRLSAQFTAANSGDKRGMSWLGFLIAVISVSFGAALSLIVDEKNYLPASIAMVFAFGMLISTFKAISSIWPGLFSFPGNEPKNWFPENWHEEDTSKHCLKTARIEQALVLQSKIEDNIEIAKLTTEHLRQSINWAIFTVMITGIFLFIFFLFVAYSESKPVGLNEAEVCHQSNRHER